MMYVCPFCSEVIGQDTEYVMSISDIRCPECGKEFSQSDNCCDSPVYESDRYDMYLIDGRYYGDPCYTTYYRFVFPVIRFDEYGWPHFTLPSKSFTWPSEVRDYSAFIDELWLELDGMTACIKRRKYDEQMSAD